MKRPVVLVLAAVGTAVAVALSVLRRTPRPDEPPGSWQPVD